MRRLLCLLVLSSSSSLAAQEARRISADDYARAERFLAANTTPPVSGTGGARLVARGLYSCHSIVAGGRPVLVPHGSPRRVRVLRRRSRASHTRGDVRSGTPRLRARRRAGRSRDGKSASFPYVRSLERWP